MRGGGHDAKCCCCERKTFFDHEKNYTKILNLSETGQLDSALKSEAPKNNGNLPPASLPVDVFERLLTLAASSASHVEEQIIVWLGSIITAERARAKVNSAALLLSVPPLLQEGGRSRTFLFFFFLSLLLFFVKPHTTLRTYVLRALSGAAKAMKKKPPGYCHTWAKVLLPFFVAQPGAKAVPDPPPTPTPTPSLLPPPNQRGRGPLTIKLGNFRSQLLIDPF